MPGLYAHYLFGREVLEQLPEELKAIAQRQEREYTLGLQGPDLLFYYHPLRRSRVCRQGLQIHREAAAEFLEPAAQMLRDSEDEAALAYILGFICHFVLDSACHPVIQTVIRERGVSHAEIEAEFDRYVLKGRELSPYLFSPLPLIPAGPEVSLTASLFYPGVIPKQLDRSIRTMKRCFSIVYSSRRSVQRIIKICFSLCGHYRSLNALVDGKHPKLSSRDIRCTLQPVYLQSVEVAARLLEEFYEGLENDRPLNIRFARNFK